MTTTEPGAPLGESNGPMGASTQPDLTRWQALLPWQRLSVRLAGVFALGVVAEGVCACGLGAGCDC